jgi:hypothetical protein
VPQSSPVLVRLALRGVRGDRVRVDAAPPSRLAAHDHILPSSAEASAYPCHASSPSHDVAAVVVVAAAVAAVDDGDLDNPSPSIHSDACPSPASPFPDRSPSRAPAFWDLLRRFAGHLVLHVQSIRRRPGITFQAEVVDGSWRE